MSHWRKGRSVFARMMAIWLAANLLLGSTGQEDSPKEKAAALAKKARKAVKSNKEADAYLLYSEAAAMQPGNRKLKAKMEALQSRAALQAGAVPAESPDPD